MSPDQAGSAPSESDPVEVTRRAMMHLNEQVTPFREWLAGHRAYFARQGYTADEARAMAAALFVTVFGARIPSQDEP